MTERQAKKQIAECLTNAGWKVSRVKRSDEPKKETVSDDEEAIAGAIETWRREGLLGVFVEAAGLLNDQGIEKHGVQGYRALTLEELRSKAIRHETRAGEIADSGSDHAIHAFVRAAQVAVLAGERR